MILEQPICRINATHNCPDAYKGNDEQVRGSGIIDLAIGSTMLSKKVGPW